MARQRRPYIQVVAKFLSGLKLLSDLVYGGPERPNTPQPEETPADRKTLQKHTKQNGSE